MIRDYDRAHWFGASDSKYIMGMSKASKSWNDWWKVKCGIADQAFHGNIYTKAGNTFEHSILKAWDPCITFDRQILVPNLRLRVNLDGNTDDEIFEVKTYQIDKGFKVSEAYYYQAQMQMLAWKLEPIINWVDCEGQPYLLGKNKPLQKHTILAYGLYPDEYYAEYSHEQIENGEIPIDRSRIQKYEIKPSRGTMRRARKYLKKLSQRLRREELIKERGTMVRESAIVYEEQLCELLSLMKDASDALDVRVRGLSLSLATHKNNDFYLRGVSDDVGVGIEELEIALESIKGCVEDIKEELANEVNNAE